MHNKTGDNLIANALLSSENLFESFNVEITVSVSRSRDSTLSKNHVRPSAGATTGKSSLYQDWNFSASNKNTLSTQPTQYGIK